MLASTGQISADAFHRFSDARGQESAKRAMTNRASIFRPGMERSAIPGWWACNPKQFLLKSKV